MLDGVNWSEKD